MFAEQPADSYFSAQGYFLPWHRMFVYLYEKALREECGYTGYQPYWDWPEYAYNQQDSPLFDNSSTSIGGDGAYIPHGTVNFTAPGLPGPFSFPRPPGTGGGCIQSGPFKNMTITLGPLSAPTIAGNKNPGPNGLGYNPRCLVRDFLTSQSTTQLTYEDVTDLITQSDSIHTFEPKSEGAVSVHAGGHGYVGDDMGDLFSSPNDPVFYMHHAMLDRVWTIWQSVDPATRIFALDGTETFFNCMVPHFTFLLTLQEFLFSLILWSTIQIDPPSANVTLDDPIHFGAVNGFRQIPITDVMSSTAGPFCYMYE
ncbi:MAG: hypothetical protein MMC33_002111 [Icmadophila ericetorum]|nr:hypothetical protein [Icmadophila ericetorum]